MAIFCPDGVERIVELSVLWPAYDHIGVVRVVRFNRCFGLYGTRIQDGQFNRILFGMAVYCMVGIRVLFKRGYFMYELNL